MLAHIEKIQYFCWQLLKCQDWELRKIIANQVLKNSRCGLQLYWKFKVWKFKIWPANYWKLKINLEIQYWRWRIENSRFRSSRFGSPILNIQDLENWDLGCLPFTPKNRKFRLENQMVRPLPFGMFRKKWAVVWGDPLFPLFSVFPVGVRTISTSRSFQEFSRKTKQNGGGWRKRRCVWKLPNNIFEVNISEN